MTVQKTLKKAITFSGVGLHTGKRVLLEVLPALENHGIQFLRVDIPGAEPILAHVSSVSSTTRATSLSRGKSRVTTVEHLLSALAALGITNALCKMDAEEIPVLDGSSLPFIKALRKNGVQSQKAPRRFIEVLETVEVRDGDKLARISPADRFSIECAIAFDHPAIGSQKFIYSSDVDFETEISPSRTFGFLNDVERMRAMGLALGGSLENTVVLDGATIVNPEGLRFKDEFVRHKVLDAIGDLALAGDALVGRVELFKSGHEMQTRLVRELLARPSAYRVRTTLEEAGQEADVIAQDNVAFA